ALFLKEDRSSSPRPAPTAAPASPVPTPTTEHATPLPAAQETSRARTRLRDLPDRGVIGWLLVLSALLMFATVSAEPIITVHVERLGVEGSVALTSALVFSLTAL